MVAVIALIQKNDADNARESALSQSLVNASALQLSQDPELAVLLGVQGYRARADVASEDELRLALHEDYVRAAVRLPQGHFVALADVGNGRIALVSDTGKMSIWDSLHDTHGQHLQAVAWSTSPIVDMVGLSGGRVATIDQAGNVAVGIPPSPAHIIGQHPTAQAIAATPGGTGFVTVGNDGVARQWSADGGAPTVLVHTNDQYVSVAPAAGGLILLDDANGAVSAWRGGHPVAGAALQGLDDINWVSSGAGGRYVAAAALDGFFIWRVAGDQLVRVMRVKEPEGSNWVAIAPDGRTAASADGDSQIRLWSLPGGQQVGDLVGLTGTGFRVAFDPVQDRLLAVAFDGSARSWDWQAAIDPTLTDPALPLSSAGDNSKGSLAFLQDGRAVVIDANGDARVWTPASDATSQLYGQDGSGVSAAAITPDGRTIVAGYADGHLQVRNALGQTLFAMGPSTAAPEQFALTPDGRTLVAATTSSVFRVDVRNGARPVSAPINGSPTSVALAPDGGVVAIGTADGATMLWGPNGSLRTIAQQPGQVFGLAFSPDGRYLASAGSDHLVRVFDLTGDRPPIVLRGHTGEVVDVAFSASGQYLASAGFDGMRLWDWRRGVTVLDVSSGDRHDYTVAVSADGHQVLVLNDGGTVRAVTCDVCVPQSQLLESRRISRDARPHHAGARPSSYPASAVAGGEHRTGDGHAQPS